MTGPDAAGPGDLPGEFRRVAELALEEDLRYGADLTTLATIAPHLVAEAEFTPRAAGVLAGVPGALAVLDLVGGPIDVLRRLDDGAVLSPGEPLLVVRGPVRALLTAERTALNLLTHLSGIATLTSRWVQAVQGTGCTIRDTRKTLPGLRLLEKYAVRCGGGANHRLGLGDALLVKDNHIAAAGSVAAALSAAREAAAAAGAAGAGANRAGTGSLVCEVEVDDLAALDEALAGGAEIVLLDNFSVPDCAEAVRRTRRAGTGTLLEASGGLTLEQARAYAETGVDYLAVGALTHSAPSLDIGLDLRS